MALETVLVAVGPGDSDRADALASAVADVAGPAGADVVVAHVTDSEQFKSTLERLDYGPQSEPDPDEIAGRVTFVSAIVDRLDEAGVPTDVRGRIDDAPGEAIVSLTEELGADLVFVGGRRRSPTSKAVIGSTAQYVLLNAGCPVTFVRSE